MSKPDFTYIDGGAASDPALPPDIDGQNDDRAELASEAVLAFQAGTGTDNGDAVADLLCDLMHFCDRNPDAYGSFKDALRRGLGMYRDETGRGEDFALTEEEEALPLRKWSVECSRKVSDYLTATMEVEARTKAEAEWKALQDVDCGSAEFVFSQCGEILETTAEASPL